METRCEEHAGHAERILDRTQANGMLPTYCVVQDTLFAKIKAIYRLDWKTILSHLLNTLSYH